MELSGHAERKRWLGLASPSDATFTVAPSVQNGLPTVKPVRLIADAIMDCSKVGDLILDGFGGSGSTLLAAEKTKRKAALIGRDLPSLAPTASRHILCLSSSRDMGM